MGVMFDLLIHGGRVVDGAGNPWFEADVGIVGDRIAAVGALAGERAARRIDADGMVVSPGFIDMHTHSDIQLLVHPRHEAKVLQGVTLDVLGQDGLSYAPNDERTLEQLRRQLVGWNDDPAGFDWSWSSVAGFLGRFDEQVAINVAYLVPHGTVRMMAMGQDDRAPTTEELGVMRKLVARGIAEGAVGLSAGLTYAPGMYATDDELTAIASVMAGTGGFYCPHHRSYGATAMQAYGDSIEVARAAGVPLHLAHAHLGFEINRGRAPELLAMIDEARAEGVDVTLDTYPYLAGATYLHSILPGWAHAGGPEEILARVAREDLRDRLRDEIEDKGSEGFHGVPVDWSMLVVSGVAHERNGGWSGRSVADIAAERGIEPFDFFREALIDEQLGTTVLLLIGNEENVREIMTHPAHMVGSDGILVGERPHPRAFGTFPRYLAHYVRELGILTLEQAVRKMTSLPAQRLGLGDRGLVRPGMAADIVCFDPDGVRDTATYEDPRRAPEGIPYVLVNGRVVVDDGDHTGELPGRALRRAGRGTVASSSAV
jgi:N-acyl-D-amino-acid deacylase